MTANTLFNIENLGTLFTDVQQSEIFPDSKFFVDCIPLLPADEILLKYDQEKYQEGFHLSEFIASNFKLPEDPSTPYVSEGKAISQHLEELWDVLMRKPDETGGTLIALPYSYIVPGGRFREIYYWDSYFTMLGLEVSGRWDIIENMVGNFAFLIDKLGFIPNGNRTYYLGRSQPPFFSLMVKLLADKKGEKELLKYQQQLEKEYNFWMDGQHGLQNGVLKRCVKMPGSAVLNRYWDAFSTPRPESYIEDVRVAKESSKDSSETYRHLRAAAESGWDFSSRWFKDSESLGSIFTTDLIPVDLNCLLLHLEEALLEIYKLKSVQSFSNEFERRINERKSAIHKYCWNPEKTFFTDFDNSENKASQSLTLAGMFPLYFKIANREQADMMAKVIEKEFLKDGGLVTTTLQTGQQWDFPNGWAPLQYIAVKGLENYGYKQLAKQIADRWIELNLKVFSRTGKMMEKYNVVDTSLEAGGGEYLSQDGFGWTNGVLLRFMKDYQADKQD